MTPVIDERWEKLKTLSLKSGAHSPDSTFCVMEAVAFVAGEEWSDRPQCACPVIGAFLRSWNDGLPSDAERDRLLKDLIPQLVGTRNKDVERKRSLMAADWLIRTHTPAWLRLAGLVAQAERLEALPEITDMKQYPSLKAGEAMKPANVIWIRATEPARKDNIGQWVLGAAFGVLIAWLLAGLL
jgi:hypothetical protein